MAILASGLRVSRISVPVIVACRPSVPFQDTAATAHSRNLQCSGLLGAWAVRIPSGFRMFTNTTRQSTLDGERGKT